MPNSGKNQRFFVPCDLYIWRMTLKNNRAPLLCYFKLCTSFHSHLWIHTRVTVRKRLWFWPLWPWFFTSDLDLLHGYHVCHWLKSHTVKLKNFHCLSDICPIIFIYLFKFVKSLIRHLGLAVGNVRHVRWFSLTLKVYGKVPWQSWIFN